MNPRISAAVKTFWLTRQKQSARQENGSRLDKDQGARSAVTAGKHLDGFLNLLREMIVRMGIAPKDVYTRGKVELPGYYRPEKQWDIVVVHNGDLLAAIELKSQVGPSFGSNYNNRCEEAMGNAFDFWAAFDNGAHAASPRPWLGYLMLLEDSEKSSRAVNVDEPHFPVLPEFHKTSYGERYAVLLKKLVDQSMYSGACYLLSPRQAGADGVYSEPEAALGFATFANSLNAHVKHHLASS